MLSTKKNTRLVITAIATTLITLALCVYSVYCASLTRPHTWLQRLLANSNTTLLLIISQLSSQAFLFYSVCRYCRRTSMKKREIENWTHGLNELM